MMVNTVDENTEPAILTLMCCRKTRKRLHISLVLSTTLSHIKPMLQKWRLTY